MFKSLNNISKISLTMATFLLVGNSSVNAQITPTQTNDQIIDQMQKQQILDNDSLGQINSVDELQDVKPVDWAYESLKSLAEKYNCLTLPGDNSNIFQGEKSLTRYEFANGLNQCLTQIEKLIGNVGKDFIKKEDLEKLYSLKQNFEPELAELSKKLDTAEGKITKLEKNNFSNFVKLNGEAIFNFTAFGGDDLATLASGKIDDNQVSSYRLRLNFVYRLKEDGGKNERLRFRLSARNNTALTTGTFMTRSGSSGDSNNNVDLQRLEYVNELLLDKKLTLKVNLWGGDYDDIVLNYNPLFANAGDGSISGFGRYSTIYRQNEGGTGVSLDYQFNTNMSLSLGYLVPANVANNPASDRGLFNGSYAGLVQLNLKPNDKLSLGLTYVNSYYNPGFVRVSGNNGSAFSNQPFGNIQTSANHFGLEGNYKFSPGFTLGAWLNYTMATAETGTFKGQDANIMNWAVSLGFPQKNGNLLGFIIGMPPKVIDNVDSTKEDKGTSYHLEGLYRYQVSKNISITPGILVILNPEHNDNNDPVWVGTLRTTLTF